MRWTVALASAALFLLSASGGSAKPGDTGYLSDAGAPDMVAVLPPAPPPDGPENHADQEIFKSTRSLEGTPRWTLATSDSDEKAILADMSCAAGAQLSAEAAPRLATLLQKMKVDVERGVNQPKNYYMRPRPFFSLPGDICVARNDNASPDYPSGHATWGWSVGLVLAELDPDRATQILVRARAFGESRVVCGVHNASTIEASRSAASAVVATLHGNAEFRADLDAARAEMASLRARAGAPSTACAAEADLTARTPWR
jgi:acid phosphatase (class A)